MKKILFYTLLIVLFVNCRKVEAKKDPIEGTWRFHEVFTENLSINQKLSCFNEEERNLHNSLKIYMGFQKESKGYFNAYPNNTSYEIRAEASWYKEDGSKYLLSIFPNKTNKPPYGITFPKPQHQNIVILKCYLKSPKEMECSDWIALIKQEDLVDCQKKPISNITPEQLQYRFKKD